MTNSSMSKIMRDIKKALERMNKLHAVMQQRTPTAWQLARMKELEDEWKRLCKRLPRF